MSSEFERSATWTGSHHAVKFYDNEPELYDLVGSFLADGVSAGEPAVIIATAVHREAIASRLRDRGIADDDPRVMYLDAGRTLHQFMNGDMPDEQRFREIVGAQLTEMTNRYGGPLRAYGEMVDVLWGQNNAEAALRVEELWNDLSNVCPFALLCAYRMGNFLKESDTFLLDEVCRRHEHVLPVPATDGRELVLLQQRANALEAEVLRCKELEVALRDALSARRRAEGELKGFVEQHAFLLEATTVLTSSLDYETRLRDLAELVVPRLADWCAVDIASDDAHDALRITHNDPASLDREALSAAVACALHNGTLVQEASWMVVPMKVGPRILGAISLGRETGNLHRSPGDVSLIVELARRAAIAIDNARLYRMAQEANRTKDEFLATLSHELRTPLTAILGWANMLNLGGLTEDLMRTATETIERSARTQATIIDDLLDLSRAVTGKFSLRQESIDVMTVVDGAVQTLRLAAEARQVKVHVTSSLDRLTVTGDTTRLQQIVWNLLSNAVKFSEAGGVVDIEIGRHHAQARIVVRDRGRGIAPEFLPHVFEPFRQASSNGSRDHGGLGLGLAIVKYLTELHGGTVLATSAGEGAGATFSVSLPLAVLPQRAAGTTGQMSQAGQGGQAGQAANESTVSAP
jgi:signal transduction histidine kinase